LCAHRDGALRLLLLSCKVAQDDEDALCTVLFTSHLLVASRVSNNLIGLRVDSLI